MMIDNSIQQVKEHVNFQVVPVIMTIDAFDRKGEWFIQVVFKGGATAITAATQDEITQVEYDLRERGWQVDPSLFHAGFNAKPGNGLGRWWAMRGDAAAIAGMDYDDEEQVFASSADLWPEGEYAIEEARL